MKVLTLECFTYFPNEKTRKENRIYIFLEVTTTLGFLDSGHSTFLVVIIVLMNHIYNNYRGTLHNAEEALDRVLRERDL